jgi:hypothetical protein
MARATQYQMLVRKMRKLANAHPRSYVAMDGKTSKVIATGRSLRPVAEKAHLSVQERQVPVIFRKQQKNKIHIL